MAFPSTRPLPYLIYTIILDLTVDHFCTATRFTSTLKLLSKWFAFMLHSRIHERVGVRGLPAESRGTRRSAELGGE